MRWMGILHAVLAAGFSFGLTGSAQSQQLASSVSISDLDLDLRNGAVEKAERGAAQLLRDRRTGTHDDSLDVLHATRILLQARLRLGHADASMDSLADAFMALCEALREGSSTELALAHEYKGYLARERRQYDQAQNEYRHALAETAARVGADHAETARVLCGLARVLMESGQPAAARDSLERALDIRERRLDPNSPEIAKTLVNLNEARIALGDSTGVRASYARAASIFLAAEGEDGPDVFDVMYRESVWRVKVRNATVAAGILDRLISRQRLVAGSEPQLAQSLRLRATVSLRLGQIDTAASQASEAMGLYERCAGRNTWEVAACLVILGDCSGQAVRYREAEGLYVRALSILRGPPVENPSILTDCLCALASLSLTLSRHAETLLYAREALATTAHHYGPSSREAAIARIALGAALRAAQQPDSAQSQYARAQDELTRVAGPDDVILADALLGLGALARERGDLASARGYVERALALREGAYGPGDQSLSPCLHELGIIERQLGDESGARTSLDRALRIAMSGSRSRLEQGAILSSIATAERARGDLRAAEGHFREAQAVIRESLPPDHPSNAQILRNLASLENATGRFSEAEADYRSAISILERTLPGHPDLGATYLGLGNALKAVGDTLGARSLYRRAISIHRDALGPESAALALDYYNLATLLLESGDLHAAMDTASVAEVISQRHFKLIAQGVSEREALHYSAGRVQGTDIILTCAARSRDVSDWKEAWDRLIHSRALVLEEIADRRAILASVRDSTTSRIEAELSEAGGRLAQLVVQGRGDLAPEAHAQRVEAARREKETAERALAARCARYTQLRARENVGFSEVVGALPERSALIAWVRYNRLERLITPGTAAAVDSATSMGVPSYAAFVLAGPHREPIFVDLGSATEIDERILRWHAEAARGLRGRGQETAFKAYLKAGQELRESVWDPVAAGITDVDHILLVPDGSLTLVNFGALPTTDQTFLIEDEPILTILSSEREVIPAEGSGTSGDGMLTIAAPDYQRTPSTTVENSPATARPPTTAGAACGEYQSLSFGRIPETRVEQDRLTKVWQDYGQRPRNKDGREGEPLVIALTGTEATEGLFRQYAPGRNVIHIATHGFFLGEECMGRRTAAAASELDELAFAGMMAESPLLLSGLAFAGANQRTRTTDAADDGILTAEEIVALDLSGVDLVVLSACQTGLGKIETGEGVFGFRRAFQIAGAHTLVMALWSVNDQATRAWMDVMFEQRLRHGHSIAEAVRTASREILRDRRSQGLDIHPFYWGAFVSVGDWN